MNDVRAGVWKWALIASASMLHACGGTVESSSANSNPACTSPVVGNWLGTTRSDHLVIGSSTAFNYTGVDGCTDRGTIECPDPKLSSGTLRVHVESSTAGSCLSGGDYSCAFDVNGVSMDYDCTGSGALRYRRL